MDFLSTGTAKVAVIPKNTKHYCTTKDGALGLGFDMIPFPTCDFSLTERRQNSSLIFF